MTVRPMPKWADLTRQQQRDFLACFEGPMAITSYMMKVEMAAEETVAPEFRCFSLADLDVVTVLGEKPAKPRALIAMIALPISAKPFVVEVRLTKFGEGALYLLKETVGA